ncbi:unnamed protein product, partial [Mycena citricolor]
DSGKAGEDEIPLSRQFKDRVAVGGSQESKEANEETKCIEDMKERMMLISGSASHLYVCSAIRCRANQTTPIHQQLLSSTTHIYRPWKTTRCAKRRRRSPRVSFSSQGLLVDLYVPRKCAATNRLITSKDHASVQISIVDVDANGRALNTTTTFALCGQVRSQGESETRSTDWQRRLAVRPIAPLCRVTSIANASAVEECVVLPEVIIC